MTLYEELELSTDCTFDEIKQQYRIMAQLHHPDKGGDIEKFKRIKLAYEVLSDPIRRKQYDIDKTTFIRPGVREEAVFQLSEIFFQMIQTFNCRDGNLIQALKNATRQLKDQAIRDNATNESFISNLEYLKEKIKIKNQNEEDILLGLVSKQLDFRYEDKKVFERRMKVAEEMTFILDNYNYGFLELPT